MKRATFYILFAIALLSLTPLVAAKPKMVVNIVVGGMQADDLVRYEEGFSEGGFKRLTSGGALYTECYTDFVANTSETALATLSTGALPSLHGISSSRWYDRTNHNAEVLLCRKKGDVECRADDGINSGFTTDHLSAQTLADAVVASHAKARAITIAQSANSAILLAGRSGECYWLDKKGWWCSADCYSTILPSWVKSHNEIEFNKVFVTGSWFGTLAKNRYRNSRHSDIIVYDAKTSPAKTKNNVTADWAKQLAITPAGNSAVLEFGKKAFNNLFHDNQNKSEARILNIYLDAARNIAQKYGSDSIEYEDMLYRLDKSLSEFLSHIYAQVKQSDDIIVVLTSDRGALPFETYELSNKQIFNSRQAEVILNAFLSARYGQGIWVLGYHNNSIYLNRDTIYANKRTLNEIQAEAAAFAIQFRGIANALTSEAMQSGSFMHGTARLIQNSFYPQRSGDVCIALLPHHIDNESAGAASGSPYNYDRHVPLVIYGGGTPASRIDKRVSTASIAPTLASLLGVRRPDCSEADILTDIKPQ